jgi:hypothetical protein
LALLFCLTPAGAQTIDRLDTVGPYLGESVRRNLREQNAHHRGNREVTFKLSFHRNGSFLSPPQRTFSSPNAAQQPQQAFVADISNALKSCTPLPFSKELSGAIAERPFIFRYKLQPKQDLRA